MTRTGGRLGKPATDPGHRWILVLESLSGMLVDSGGRRPTRSLALKTERGRTRPDEFPTDNDAEIRKCLIGIRKQNPA